MPTPSEWNRLVNNRWPDDVPIPSEQEAITGVKRLYRKAMGKPFRGKVVITSGNRYTWGRGGVIYVNPNRRGAWPRAGWPDIIHLLAHYCHRRKHWDKRPHHYTELLLEADLTKYAIEHGFHEGRLKRKAKAEKPKPNRQAKAHQAAVEGLARWQRKLKRAETGVKKYRQKVRYYEREAAKKESLVHPVKAVGEGP
jgi:hypothetical protein